MHQAAHNGFVVGINMPPALTGEGLHGLPPYARINHYEVDRYPEMIDLWGESDLLTKKIVVGVQENKGMWIDLTANARRQTETAVIASVQGHNALTALKVPENPVLEQYRHNCPISGRPFTGNRYSEATGFEWPAQNYIGSDTGKRMWIDGFRTTGSNGEPLSEVRQFVFTADESRGVAAQMGDVNRPFSIKLFFYEGPVRPQPRVRTLGSGFDNESVQFESFGAASNTTRGMRSKGLAPEIAAGARIRQDIGVDQNNVSVYGGLAAVIEVFYVYEDVLRPMLVNRTGEGPLQGIKVGNPAHSTY